MVPTKQFQSISRVVFTGPAEDAKGRLILRADLIASAVARGWTVQKSVQRTTELLVASRTDTVKARKAKQQGVIVVSYPDFLAHLGQVVPTGAKPDWNTDRQPVKTKPQQLSLLAAMQQPADMDWL